METLEQQLYKIILIGEPDVGKTSILYQYVRKSLFVAPSKIGVDFLNKEILLQEKKIKLRIWDTAGVEHYRMPSRSFYKESDCCIFVYDITNRKSFEALVKWKKEFLSKIALEDTTKFPFVLLGNKVDEESERKVKASEAEAWCEFNGKISYFEVSAKNNILIDEVFQTIVDRLVVKKN